MLPAGQRENLSGIVLDGPQDGLGRVHLGRQRRDGHHVGSKPLEHPQQVVLDTQIENQRLVVRDQPGKQFQGERLRKGRPIIVEGRLKSDEWEDKETGQRRT